MKKEKEEIEIVDEVGKVSRQDKWDYNNTLNILVRNAIFTKGTGQFYGWVDRFATALRAVQLKHLPLRDIIDKEKKKMNKYYNEDMDYLEEEQPHPFKRGITEDWLMQKHYEKFLDFLLDLATQAGFTINLDSVDESVALRSQ